MRSVVAAGTLVITLTGFAASVGGGGGDSHMLLERVFHPLDDEGGILE